MNINNNFTPLAWHKGNVELQSNRATYAFGHVVPLMVHSQTVLPFQIVTEHDEVDLSDYTVGLYNVDGSVKVPDVGLSLVKKTYDDVDVLIYNGDALQTPLPIGQYYFVLSSTDSRVAPVWYSDVVTVVNNVLGMTSMEWWDEYDLKFNAGVIAYKYVSGGQSVQYKNRMYFVEEIGMPEYTVEEEGDTRDGLFYASRVLSGKNIRCRWPN